MMAEQKMGRMRRYAPANHAQRCQDKTRWQSELGAQRALTALKRANPGAFDSTVRPYRCPSCKRWHVGYGR